MADEDKNPPQAAVALKYNRSEDPAPRIVAKGKGAIAESIIRMAEEMGIAVYQDANLVQILEKLDLDAIIPLEAYTAVAEILNYVYKTNARAKAARRNTI